MRKFQLNKLVRDKVVENTIAVGDIPAWRTLDDVEYIKELKNKTIEESKEILNATDDELVVELADMQEIIDSILIAVKVSKQEFRKIRKVKIKKKGAFKKRIYIESLEVKENSKWSKYLEKQPDKYPEVNS